MKNYFNLLTLAILFCLVIPSITLAQSADMAQSAENAKKEIAALKKKLSEASDYATRVAASSSPEDAGRVISILEEALVISKNAEKEADKFNASALQTKDEQLKINTGEARADVSELATETNRVLRKAHDMRNAENAQEMKEKASKVIKILKEMNATLNIAESYLVQGAKKISN